MHVPHLFSSIQAFFKPFSACPPQTKELGAEVKIYDPYLKSNSDFDCVEDFLDNIDYLIIATDHDEILELSPHFFEEKNIKLIIDCKNKLNKDNFNSIICKGIGR